MSESREAVVTNTVLLAGRVLLAACFIPTAYAHMSNISGFAVSMRAQGLPSTDALAALVVLAEAFGPLALLLGFAPRISACALMGATALTTGALHRFWEFGAAIRPMEQAVFLSQVGILAALLFYIVAGPGAWSWQAWWRGATAKPKPAARKKLSRPRTPKARPAPAKAEQPDDEWADAA
jgi:putative oxidoreductase